MSFMTYAPRVFANKSVEKLIQGLNILVVDGNSYMRRLTRMMLMNLGAKSVMEVADDRPGSAALVTAVPPPRGAYVQAHPRPPWCGRPGRSHQTHRSDHARG